MRKNKHVGLMESKLDDIIQGEEEKVAVSEANSDKAQSIYQSWGQHIANIDKIKNILTPSQAHHLVIFELESEIIFYVTTKKSLESFKSLKTSHIDDISKCIDRRLISESSFDLNTFKNDLQKNIKNHDEVGVKKLGSLLCVKLMPWTIQAKLKEELQSDNKIKDVWVFCEEKHIDYLWEWIYWENATERFFWGDRFHICRIPNDIAGNEFKELTCTIENGVAIIDTFCDSARIDSALFKSQPNWVIIELQNELDELKKLGNVDYIHVVIHVKTIERDSNTDIELLSSKLEKFLKTKKPKFLFLNIRGTGDNRIIGIFKKIFTDKVPIWIDTNLDLEDNAKISFTQDFYKILRESKDREIAEVVTEARNTCNSFCRLAYVIKGSPHTTIIWACR
jgi:hypothetical protein